MSKLRLTLLGLLFFLVSLSFRPFFPPEIYAETVKRAGLTAQEEAAWREHGFGRDDAGEWKYFGIGPNDARKWINVGIQFPAWADQWKGEGFFPEEAAKWKDLTNVYTAGEFYRYGFSVEEAKAWMDKGIKSGLRAKEYREAGMSPETGGDFWELSLYPDDAKAWYEAGFTPKETIEWHYGPRDVAYFHTKETMSSWEVFPLKWAQEWKGAGFSPEEARAAKGFRIEMKEALEWKDAGFSFREMVRWKDSGFDIASALEGKGAGLDAVEAERKRDEGWSGDEIPEVHYDLDLKKDGQVGVTVTLTLINRPKEIYSESFYLSVSDNVPLRFRGSHTRPAAPAYKIRYVEMDGAGTDYRIKDGLLHVGRMGSPLSDGSHRIKISYVTDDRLVRFDDHDELYFPIIENNKGVRIGNLSAAVRLPKGAQIIFADGYAGLEGRKDFKVRVKETDYGDMAAYEATRPLRDGMHFLISIAFIKGYVEPGIMQELRQLDRRSGRMISAATLFISVVISVIVYFRKIRRRMKVAKEGK